MSSTGSAASLSSSISRRIRRLGRFLLFLCTAGWAFPHVCTDDMDLTRIQDEHIARKQ
jgi:hypothetical protein